MNLISCDDCGVVLDANKLEFPDDIYDLEGAVDDKLAGWNGDHYVAKVKCPVCSEDILKGQ